MNWDQAAGNWKQFKGKVKEQWGKLTDDEIDQIGGKRDQLIGKIQKQYGISKEEAETQVKHWEAYGIEGTGNTHQFDIDDQRSGSGQAYVTVGALEGDLDDMLSVTMEVGTNPLNGLDQVACAQQETLVPEAPARASVGGKRLR